MKAECLHKSDTEDRTPIYDQSSDKSHISSLSEYSDNFELIMKSSQKNSIDKNLINNLSNKVALSYFEKLRDSLEENYVFDL
jgi:hypothetical protein